MAFILIVFGDRKPYIFLTMQKHRSPIVGCFKNQVFSWSEGFQNSMFSHVYFLYVFLQILASKMNLKWRANWGYEHCTFLTRGPLGVLWDAQGGSLGQFHRFGGAQGGSLAQFHRFRCQNSRACHDVYNIFMISGMIIHYYY